MNESPICVTTISTKKYGGCNFCTKKTESVREIASKDPHRHISILMCEDCIESMILKLEKILNKEE